MKDLKSPNGTSPPPPDYTLKAPLSVSQSDFTLSVPSGKYHPGDSLRLTLTAPPSAQSHVIGDIICTLEGSSTVELMGKKRYQTAMMVNAGMGSGGAAMITSRETHTFVKVSSIIPLRVSKEDGGIEHEIVIPIERTCACEGDKRAGVLPTFGADDDETDESSVEWRLGVVVKRKGFLKRDIKLSLSIPISLLPSYRPFYPLTATSTATFAYTSQPSTSPPTHSAHLSLSPSSSNKISFHLTLTSQPPSLLPSYPSIPPSENFGISLVLIRKAWTKGIDQANFGDPGGFSWSGKRVGIVSLPPVAGKSKGWIRNVPMDEMKGDGMEFEGEYEVPSEGVSVKGCGVAVDWSVHANISWKKLNSTLSVEIPIILPIS